MRGRHWSRSQDEDDEAQIPLTLDALYRDGDAVVSGADDADGPRADDAGDADGEDATTCPVCFRLLRDLADTQPARLAHVNACLDGGSGGGIHDEEDVVDLVRTDTDDTFGATWDEGGEGEWHDVAAWLHAVDHGDFAEAAVRLRLTFESLDGCVDEDDLASLGHVGDRARRRALLAAVAARRPREAIPGVEAIQPGGAPERDEAPGGGEDDRGENVGTSRKGWHPTRVAAGVAPVFARARGELTEPPARAPARKEPPARRPEASRHVQKRRRTGAENAPVEARRVRAPRRAAPRRRRRGSASPAPGSSWTASRVRQVARRVVVKTLVPDALPRGPLPRADQVHPAARVPRVVQPADSRALRRAARDLSATGSARWTSGGPSWWTACGARSSTRTTARARS